MFTKVLDVVKTSFTASNHFLTPGTLFSDGTLVSCVMLS